jgi:hypothetical protein
MSLVKFTSMMKGRGQVEGFLRQKMKVPLNRVW